MDIYDFLQSHNIPFERFDHPPVFTCEEAERLCPEMPGKATKNLFLRDDKAKRHFLVVVGYDKNVSLGELKELLGVSKLSFASPERLQKYLGVIPGAVTLLGVVNDAEHAVEVILDEHLKEEILQCHPLVNTATLTISTEGIRKFLTVTGHSLRIMNIPTR